MALLEDGYSYAYIHRTYGINSELLKALHRLYLKYGVSALQKKTNIKADYLLKQQAIIDFEEKHLSLVAIMLKLVLVIALLGVGVRSIIMVA